MIKREHLRAFVASMKIGWAIESNWTKIPLYLLYAASRPLALCLLLFFLFKVINPLPNTDPRFIAIYLGNAFFTIFGSMASGLSWAIISDREQYQLIRYIYISPSPFVWTIFGRAITLLLIALSNVVIILLIGWLGLHLPIGPRQIDWMLFFPSMALGLIATGALGILFAGLLLVTARHSILLAEGVGGVFLLICGVLYPTTYLPWYIRPLAWFNPITPWVENMRRSFGIMNFDATLGAMSNWNLLLIQLAFTMAFVVIGFKAFNRFEQAAKRAGKIDQVTNY